MKQQWTTRCKVVQAKEREKAEAEAESVEKEPNNVLPKQQQ